MTILGAHSLKETRDLLAKTDYRFKQTQNAFVDLNAKVIADHAAGHDDDYNELNNIASAWATLLPRWQVDRQKFSSELLTQAMKYSYAGYSGVAPEAVPAEDIWKELVLYLQPADDFQSGTLPDIMRRMQAFGITIDLSSDPPIGSTDVDFQVFGALDATTKAMEASAKAASDAAKKAASSNIGLILIGSVVALGGVVVLTKVYL